MDESKATDGVVVTINEKALDIIKDTARIQFQKAGRPELHKLLFNALYDYIQSQGGKPGFEVKL